MAIIRYLHLGLTAACNLNCKHCFIKEKESKELSFEKAIAFIDVLEKQGLTHIYYTYGEPLFYHRLFEFSKNIRLKGIYQVLMTNGTQINYEVAQKIAASGINRVMVSIDSSIEKKHDMNRGKQGSFGLAVQAIQLLKEQKVNVGIASTITKQNYLELAAIEKLAQENQIQYISFLACREQNRIACPLEKEYIDFVLNSIIENKQYTFHDLRLIPYIKSWYKNNRITERQCAAAISANSCCAKQTLTLAPNGDIFTCDLIDHTPIGNVYNIDLNDFSLSDILRKTNMKGCSIV